MRRVVVTGMGMVTPLACGVEPTWQRLLAGKSGARKVEAFDVSDMPCKIACSVPRGDGLRAAPEALDDSGWKPEREEDQFQTGVMIGSGIGGVEGIGDTAITLHERGARRGSPFFVTGRVLNLAAGYVSIAGKLKGPNHAVATACSTGAHAIGDASRLIALGDAEVMVAGGTESPVNRISMAGFAACRALSTGFNDEPTRASRPYDRDRDGFVLGEGA